MKITSTSMIPDYETFNLDLFSGLFCENEFPNFVDGEFWGRGGALFTERRRGLFVSGGSRNGNHLVWSLLDGSSNVPFCPGEDKVLVTLMWHAKQDEARLISRLRSDEAAEYLLSINGSHFDKWKSLYEFRPYQQSEQKGIWAGKHRADQVAIFEFQQHQHQVNYPAYADGLRRNVRHINKAKTIFEIFRIYLDCYALLTEQRRGQYSDMYAASGMRREMALLAKHNPHFKCIVPVRQFTSYYYSKVMGRYGTTELSEPLLNDAWEQWRHKTIDYLMLAKKYPDNFAIVRFEDLVVKPVETMKALCAAIDIPFEEINKTPTQHQVPVKGNSSFSTPDSNKGRVFSHEKRMALNLNDMPSEYPDILRAVDNVAV